jgi:putative transposase
MKPKTRHLVIMSFLYLALRGVFELIVLRLCSEEAKEVEIVVLRHQLQVLRRQVATPDLAIHDRAFLAAASRVLPQMRGGSLFVRPETILAWHRRLVQRRWTYARRTGRPPKTAEIRRLVWRLANESQTWGYRRIQGELKYLGITVAPSTVMGDPAAGGDRSRAEARGRELEGVPARPGLGHPRLRLSNRRYRVRSPPFVLFFIEIETRGVHLAGVTFEPDGLWVAQGDQVEG